MTENIINQIENNIKNKKYMLEDINTTVDILQAKKEWIRDSIAELERLIEEV